MPVPTKLDPVALPEKGRYVEGPLLYTPHSAYGLTEKMLGSSSRPFGKITGVSSNNARSDVVVCLLLECTYENGKPLFRSIHFRYGLCCSGHDFAHFPG